MQGHACGLLATSSDLELGLLQDCFQLDDYDYLVKVLNHSSEAALGFRTMPPHDSCTPELAAQSSRLTVYHERKRKYRLVFICIPQRP